MKLKNKKTGEIIDAIFEPCEGNVKVINKDKPSLYGEYGYLSELNKEWEDYTPAEPLIKDEKVRKAVRAWAEVNNIKNVAFEDYDDENIYFIDKDYEPQIWFPNKSVLWSSLDDGKMYTIAELCGED